MRRACLVLLLSAACGGAEPLQVVRGALAEDFPDGAAQVRAVEADVLLASAPIDGGAFVLAVPAGEVRIAVADGAGAHLAWIADAGGVPLELAICRPRAAPLDLGTIAWTPPDCSASDACRQREAALRRCEDRAIEAGCCCAEEENALGRCLLDSAPDRCSDERLALRACQESGACAGTGDTCAVDCSAARREVQQTCSLCPDARGSARAAIALDGGIGCGSR